MKKVVFLLSILIVGCKGPDLSKYPVDWSKFGKAVFLSKDRLQTLRERLADGVEPQKSSYEDVEKLANDWLEKSPKVPKHWYVPFYYLNPEGHKRAKNGLRDQAIAAYALGLVYQMTGQSKYAKKSIEILTAWTTQLKWLWFLADSKLSFSYHFSTMVLAADLVRSSEEWSKVSQKKFRKFLRHQALDMSTMNRKNNWGNWGLVLHMSVASYLKDKNLAKRGAIRWAEFIGKQIAEDGHLPHEVKRSGGMRGLWYSNFTLLPQTIAAEIIKVNGMDLYSFKSKKGRNLKIAYKRMIPWILDPSTFPYWDKDPAKLTGTNYIAYWEILNKKWPRSDVTEHLKKKRPIGSSHGAPFLTFTHGNL